MNSLRSSGLRASASAASPATSPAAYHAPVPLRRGWRAKVRVWWGEVDRVLLVLILLLMGAGIAAVLAASPASADQLSTANETVDPFRFFKRHMFFLLTGFAGMIAVSLVSRDEARRLGIRVAVIMFVLLMLVPIIGVEKNGAVRWINLGMSLQPSEFLKPGFAVALAWIFSWRARDPNLPVMWLASGITLAVGALLMMQPNLGETMLFVGTFCVLIFLSGIAMQRVAMLAGVGAAGFAIMYLTYENGRNRIDAFLSGGTAFDQVDLANRTLGQWRVDRQRAVAGNTQIQPARGAHRLHLLRHRRRGRADRLRHHRDPVSGDYRAGADPAGERG